MQNQNRKLLMGNKVGKTLLKDNKKFKPQNPIKNKKNSWNMRLRNT